MRPSFVRRTAALVAAVVVSAGLVTGCTGGGGGDGEDDKGSSGSFTPGVQQLDLNAPLVKETYVVPGSDKNKVTVGVLGLEYDGDLQVLHLAFTPEFASEDASAEISLAKMIDRSGYSSFKPQLVDRNSQKVYSVVDDVKTDTGATTTNGQPLYVYAVFAAPQNDGRVFDVRINDEWQPFIDIESVEDKGAKK